MPITRASQQNSWSPKKHW